MRMERTKNFIQDICHVFFFGSFKLPCVICPTAQHFDFFLAL